MTLFPAASPATFPYNVARSRLICVIQSGFPRFCPICPQKLRAACALGTVLAAGSECTAGSVLILCTVFWGVNRLRAVSAEWVVHPPHSQQQQS